MNSKNFKNALIVLLLFAAAGGWWVSRAKFDRKSISVLAYDEFVNSQGPGPLLIKSFEDLCECRVEMMRVSEAGLILPQLKQLQGGHAFDLVIGLDQWMLEAAKVEIHWREIQLPKIAWSAEVQSAVQSSFVPIDWAPMTFLYREGEIEPPQKPMDLFGKSFEKTMSFSDPRSSSTGLQLLRALSEWFIESPIETTLLKLKQSVLSITSSWSMSYALFQREQAKMVFSYVTSLVYHWEAQKDLRYKAVSFEKGHPVQVEFAGIPEACQECELAERFLHYLLTVESQRIIMKKNYMFPVIDEAKLNSVFSQLPKLKPLDDSTSHFMEQKNSLIKQWSHVFQ